MMTSFYRTSHCVDCIYRGSKRIGKFIVSALKSVRLGLGNLCTWHVVPLYTLSVVSLLGLQVVGVEARGKRREECDAQREGSHTHASEEHCRM